MPNRIEHLVVLMMENRSFDHMLGFLKSPDWPIDGLTGAETNPDINGVPVRVTPDARYAGDLTPDPGHDFISVNEQIFGNSTATGAANMQGFVKAYQGKTKNVQKSHNIMKCFGPGRLPTLATLAREYAVCDRWFASVPGPTLPNRAFAWAGTSLGRVDMNPNYLKLKTVFELLDGHGVSSKIYYTDVTIGLAVGFLLQRAKKFFSFFDSFRDDCKNDKLPAFSFIEPRFNNLNLPGQFFAAADQHPDHHVFQGEMVIRSVYEALTANKKVWESSLLVITYDEHGGLYDHVPPPATVNPGDGHTGSPPFSFERLGVRVPAVLVSPFIPRGTIIHNKVFDHTSIIATASKLFVTSAPTFLTQRDRTANTFEDALTLAAPRPGKVNIPQPTDAAAAAPAAHASTFLGVAEAVAKPAAKATRVSAKELAVAPTPSGGQISELTEAMIQHAFTFERHLPPQEQTGILVSSISTEQEAAEYFAAIRERLAGKHNGVPTQAAAKGAGKGRKSGKKASKKGAKKASKKGGKASKKGASKRR
ncbi:MAG: alkaline phosphatase family protein [Acidobacteria bacterium]|nr:alkaline phosphatase family protein [Acidobacteriota bacterium]